VLLKELERLRLHLVAVEEGYTQEALNAEEQVKELQNKLAQAEERIKNSSTAYTSARFGIILIILGLYASGRGTLTHMHSSVYTNEQVIVVVMVCMYMNVCHR
jgi:hypothetical protein